MLDFNPLFPEKQWQNKRYQEANGTIRYACFNKAHRTKGPAIERPKEVARKSLAPLREYYFQGELHRQGGPARIWPKEMSLPDTRLFLELPANTYLPDVAIILAYLQEEWYEMGLRHRQGGPAITSYKEEQYWQEGKLHRDGGPAVVRGKELSYLKPRHFSLPGSYLAREEYWQEGVLLYRHLDNGTRQWYNKAGELDRTEGPAVMRTKEYATSGQAEARDEAALWEYRKKGKLHRIDGPAIALLENKQVVYRWFQEGVFSRQGGPAEIRGKEEKRWIKNGKLHRVDGPALISGSYREWRFKGHLHREGGPAIENNEKEIYFLHGKRHRLDGPAYIARHFCEWYQDDFLHRIGGPAVYRDFNWSESHNLSQQEYWREGKQHRLNGPAIIYPDGSVFYYEQGQLHREGGPAVERSSMRAKKEEKPLREYYLRGYLHREDGPARIWPGGREEWWIEGILDSEKGLCRKS